MPPEADSPTTDDPVFRAHEGGKLAVAATKPLRDRDDLSLLYTPGVALVSSAIAQQAAILNTHTRYLNEAVVAFAERLVRKLPDDISQVMFACTGSEANDLALRVARAQATPASTGGQRDCRHRNDLRFAP